VDRDGIVIVVTCYGLDGPGIKPWWGRLALGPAQPHVQRVLCLFPGGKWPGRGVDYPPPSSAKVKERVELYDYFPSGPPWPVLG
jgi:hypothetical protein